VLFPEVISTTLFARTQLPAPFVVTPPQSLKMSPCTSRHTTDAAPLIFPHKIPSQNPPEPLRRGRLSLTAHNTKSGPISHDHESPVMLTDRVSQSQGLMKPSQITQLRADRSWFSVGAASLTVIHQPHKQEQVRAAQAAVSYEDDPRLRPTRYAQDKQRFCGHDTPEDQKCLLSKIQESQVTGAIAVRSLPKWQFLLRCRTLYPRREWALFMEADLDGHIPCLLQHRPMPGQEYVIF